MSSRTLRFVLAFLAVGLVSGSIAFATTRDHGRHNGANGAQFSAHLIGFNETPSLNSTGAGDLSLTIANGQMTFDLTYSGLSGNPAAAHVHIGQPGVAGGVSFFFCGGGGKPACPASTSGEGPGTVLPPTSSDQQPRGSLWATSTTWWRRSRPDSATPTCTRRTSPPVRSAANSSRPGTATTKTTTTETTTTTEPLPQAVARSRHSEARRPGKRPAPGRLRGPSAHGPSQEARGLPRGPLARLTRAGRQPAPAGGALRPRPSPGALRRSAWRRRRC